MVLKRLKRNFNRLGREVQQSKRWFCQVVTKTRLYTLAQSQPQLHMGYQELFQFLAVQIKFWTNEAKMTKKLSKLILKCLNKFKIFLNWVLKFLGRDISRKGDMKEWKNDISRSSNYSSEIYRKWDCLIYLARVITWARYIKSGIVWYISLR